MLPKLDSLVVAVICVIMGVILSSATQGVIGSPGKLTLELSKEPKLGETVQLTATFTSNKDIGLLKINFHPSLGTKITSGNSDITTTIKKGETKTFSIQVQFTSTPADISCRVGNCILSKNKEGVERLYWYEMTHSGIRRVVIDERSKQMGTDAERDRRFTAEYPEKTDYPLGIQYGRSPQNRNLIQLFLRDEPQLTKLEALWLVDKAEQNYAKDPWAHENAQSAKERDPDGTPSVFRRAVERVIDEAKLKSKQTGKVKIIIYREIIEEWKRIRKPE